ATIDALVDANLLSSAMAEFLELALRARRNVVVAGGPGAGVPLLIGALASSVPPEERVVTVEHVASMGLSREHWVALEAQPPRVSLRELICEALRLRPDRLAVGNLYGAEALDLVEAMAAGHDGVLAGLHAGSTADALMRLELLVRASGGAVPPDVARTLV